MSPAERVKQIRAVCARRNSIPDMVEAIEELLDRLVRAEECLRKGYSADTYFSDTSTEGKQCACGSGPAADCRKHLCRCGDYTVSQSGVRLCCVVKERDAAVDRLARAEELLAAWMYREPILETQDFLSDTSTEGGDNV